MKHDPPTTLHALGREPQSEMLAQHSLPYVLMIRNVVM